MNQDIKDRISELRAALADQYLKGDWHQKHLRPDHPEAMSWGSSDIVASRIDTGRREELGRIYDSQNMKLILLMRQHIEVLLDALESQ